MRRRSCDIYVTSFLARCALLSGPDRLRVDQPGVHGVLPSPGDQSIRLLVTDDRGYDRVAALVPQARAGMISVFAAAERCAELVGGHPSWRSDALTAMICRDLRAVPALSLPDGLSVHPVRRLPEDPDDGVPLEDAVATASTAAPAIGEAPDAFAEYLRSLPGGVRLFAAVDADGVVRATSGAGAFGSDANVMFVNTDPHWRRRGIGLAMTAAALASARARGARRASLEASEDGTRIYRRLGFEAVTKLTRFFRNG